MKNALLLFILAIAVISINSCADPDSVTKPEPETNCAYPVPNTNFSWRTDTVAVFPSTLGGLWAFSDSDAYLMGYIAVRNANNQTDIVVGRHWNGKKWENLKDAPMDIKHYASDVTGDDHFMVSVGSWHIGNEKAGLAEFDNRTKKWKGYQFQTPGTLYSVWTDKKGYFIAAGDNGMVYIKDGYSAEWVYVKAPTDFHFRTVTGVSKNEVYIFAGKYTIDGIRYNQIWKFSANSNWTKLVDNEDTTGSYIRFPEKDISTYDVGVYRCSNSDTLYLYLIGNRSYELKSKGNSLDFEITDLKYKLLPFFYENSALRIFVNSPNDYWVTGLRYRIYQWNGSSYRSHSPSMKFQYGELWGLASSIKKSNSGKVWMIIQLAPQFYSVAQGIPQ